MTGLLPFSYTRRLNDVLDQKASRPLSLKKKKGYAF